MSGYAGIGLQAVNNASSRNQGGQAGLLGGPGAIDGSAQSFWNLADPFNTTGNASSGHALSNILDPGNVVGQNQAANPLGPNGANAKSSSGSNAPFPNLGASTLIPITPSGTWGAAQSSGPFNPFNTMAGNAAGQLYTPTGIQAPAQAAQSSGGSKPTSSVNTGGTPYSATALPGGGGNPALGSPGGSALSRSQIYGGNVGPNGVTEPADPAFLNSLGNGMMQLVKAQYGFGNNPYLNQTTLTPLQALMASPEGNIQGLPGGGYNPNGGPR